MSSEDSSSNEFTVTLEGGGPWGFTLQGGADFRSPLKVGKVTPGGKAQNSGLVGGDIILSINGVGTNSMKHYEAHRLIVASRKTLQLVCNKVVLQSPKSSTQLMSFGYPSPPRSTTPDDKQDAIEKSKSLGRHARQSSLDLQTFRSRSYSDVKKRVSVGDNVAGVRVPAPPPKVKRKSDPVAIEQRIPRYVAGIRVPAPPPSTTVKPVQNKTSPEESPTASITTIDMPPVAIITGDTSPVAKTTGDTPPVATTTDHTPDLPTTTTTSTSVSMTTPETNDADIPPISITATSLESQESSKSSLADQSSTLTPIDTAAIDDSVSESHQYIPRSPESQLDETHSSTSGYKSINSSSEEDILSASGSGSDWYKSMFQSMKKGVEEQIPNKKHVCDRSPTPARKTTFDQATNNLKATNDDGNVSSTGRRSSESSLNSPTGSGYQSMARTSSSGTVDAVNSLNSGVVFRKNMQHYNQSRNYWKSIERQASQERIELAAAAAKRNSLRRHSSSGSVGRTVSPDISIETAPPTTNTNNTIFDSSSYTVFQEEEPTEVQEEVSITDHKSSPPPIVRTPSPLDRKPFQRTPSPIKTPPSNTSPSNTPPLKTTPPSGFTKTPSPKTPPPKTPPPKTPPPTTPPLVASSPVSKTPPTATPPLKTPSPQLIAAQETKTPPRTPPLTSVIPPRTPPLSSVTPPRTPPLSSVTPPRTPPLNTVVTPPVRSPQLDTVDFEENMSKLHPLLKEGASDEIESTPHDDDLPTQDVFTRIDPVKLNEALGHSVILGKMEQEGASAGTLQSAAIAVGQSSQEQPPPRQQKKKSRTVKPPPGEKAKALYDFQSASEKEISFKKGAIIDLTEQVDANWLKGTVDGQTGIFPINFVKVLTSDEILQLTMEVVESPPPPPPSLNLLAKAKYDFTAKSAKELSFNKHDIITLVRQIDDNWYEGTLDDNKGIVPITYIQIFDAQEN